MRGFVTCLLGSMLVGIAASGSANAQVYFDDGYGGGYGPTQGRGYYGVDRRYDRGPSYQERYLERGPRRQAKRVTRFTDPNTGRTYVRAVERGRYGPTIREEFRQPDGSKVTRRTFTGRYGQREVVIDRY
jgi:hypothetical protein